MRINLDELKHVCGHPVLYVMALFENKPEVNEVELVGGDDELMKSTIELLKRAGLIVEENEGKVIVRRK